MKSNLNLLEFRSRLKESIQIGSPKLKLGPFAVFTIFDGKSKPFYGLFDDKDFRLTINYRVTPTSFIVKGKYKVVNNILHVNYEIEPHPKFILVWVKYFPIFCFILMNSLLISSKNAPQEAFIVVNVFLVFMIFYSRWDIKRKRKNIEQKFIEIFEIE
ncbi:hypothetical protein [Flavobacterium defluvii]|uniref:Uncharacterized protein n=1 Tax=Flavobacterium defluvii TaxID=370979 RepID=A0A1M5IFY3_9FLAO|nr:hypothetical protein [Flavobacterium defluvii]SHG27135.1 hypothetical protein SAMN05443663_102385 [Flavobacterium defluvii]